MNIYEICDNCKIKYDKSKGEYIFQDKHFHSQKCLDEFIKKIFIAAERSNIIVVSGDLIFKNQIIDPSLHLLFFISIQIDRCHFKDFFFEIFIISDHKHSPIKNACPGKNISVILEQALII